MAAQFSGADNQENTMIAITYAVLKETPDFGGFNFFVEAGRAFDADDYCAAYKLNRSELDEQDVKAAQNAATQLNDGEWLKVDHEVEQ